MRIWTKLSGDQLHPNNAVVLARCHKRELFIQRHCLKVIVLNMKIESLFVAHELNQDPYTLFSKSHAIIICIEYHDEHFTIYIGDVGEPTVPDE